jgi:hypothetical protein
MLVELCVNIYATHDSLVIGVDVVDGIFQSSTKLFNSQKIIWIYCLINPNVVNSQGQSTHLYKLDIHPTHGHQYNMYPKISKLVQNFPIL